MDDGSNDNGGDDYILSSLDAGAREIDAIFASRRRNHRRKKFTGVEIFIPPLPSPLDSLSLLDHDRALCDRNLISPRRARGEIECIYCNGITGRIDASCTFQRQTSADARLTAAVKQIIYGLSLCLTRGKRACFVPFCPPLLFFPPSSKLTRAENNAYIRLIHADGQIRCIRKGRGGDLLALNFARVAGFFASSNQPVGVNYRNYEF